MSKGWAGGSTTAWRKTRARVLARDGHTCQLKLEGCARIASTAHHTQGIKITGMHDERFIVAACANCNTKIGEPAADPPEKPQTRW